MITRNDGFLAALGNVDDVSFRGGKPHYFLEAARRRGLLTSSLPLLTKGFQWESRRLLWNLARPLYLTKPYGFQYSDTALEQLWEPIKPKLHKSIVVNCFQLYPSTLSLDSSIDKWHLIDMTLTQFFDNYATVERDKYSVGTRIMKDAISREKLGYSLASGIITHSKWAMNSLIADYAVPEEKIHVIPIGASLDAAEYDKWEAIADAGLRADRTNIRLVFVGNDWYRKGLDRLLGAIKIGRTRGLKATLRVIGPTQSQIPHNLRHVEGVEWMGSISKRRDMRTFIRAVSECNVGCLLSRAEAGGIAVREFQCLGLMVLGTDAGGAAEQLIPGASCIVRVDATPDDICNQLLDLERNKDEYQAMRRVAWESRRVALWEESIKQLETSWPYHRFTKSSY